MVMGALIGELASIPGPTGECAFRMMVQENQFLEWGKDLRKVEQQRCLVDVKAAEIESEGVPLWGWIVGMIGVGVVSGGLGFLFGFLTGFR